MRPTTSELLRVAGLSLLALLALYAIGTERAAVFKDDTRHYGLMADDPTYLARLPYSFRVLTPLLVSLLPFDTLSGFAIVTIGALWLSAIVLYLLLRGLGLGAGPSGAGVAVFLGSGCATRALTTPVYVDALSYLTELAGFYCLLTRREAWFAATLVLGTLNRETVLLLAPVYLLQLRGEGRLGRRDLPRVGLVLGLPILALALTAAAKLALAGGLEAALSQLRPLPRTFQQTLPSPADLADIYSTFGAAWLLAAANLRQAPPLIRRGFIFGLLVVLQLSVSRGDESRNLSHLLALVIPLAALEFRRLTGPASVALVAACLASMVTFRWTLLPSPGLRYAIVGLGSVAAVGLAAWRRVRPTPAMPRSP